MYIRSLALAARRARTCPLMHILSTSRRVGAVNALGLQGDGLLQLGRGTGIRPRDGLHLDFHAHLVILAEGELALGRQDKPNVVESASEAVGQVACLHSVPHLLRVVARMQVCNGPASRQRLT